MTKGTYSSRGTIWGNSAHSFWWAVIGLVILGIFGSCASVGFTTYIQQTMPVSHMGRINSVVGPPQQLFNIVFILLGGFAATWLGVRDLMVGMTVMMTLSALVIFLLVFQTRHRAIISDVSSEAPS